MQPPPPFAYPGVKSGHRENRGSKNPVCVVERFDSVVPTSPHFTFKTLRNITFNAKFLQGKVQGSHVQVAAKSIWKVHNFREYFSLKK